MFQRMSVDEPDNWQELTEEEVYIRLDGYYRNVSEVIQAIKDGTQVRTPFSFYRWIEGV